MQSKKTLCCSSESCGIFLSNSTHTDACSLTRIRGEGSQRNLHNHVPAAPYTAEAGYSFIFQIRLTNSV